MAERLSYELTDILGEYIVEALRAEDEIFWSFTETLEKGAASVQLVNLKKQEVVDKLKIVTEAEKEKNLKLTNELIDEVNILRSYCNRLEQAYPKHKVDFTNIQKPEPIKNVYSFFDHFNIVVNRIKDTSISAGVKKLAGFDGWKLNNEAAGELWMQLDEGIQTREKQQEDLFKQFEKFCKAEKEKAQAEINRFDKAESEKMQAQTKKHDALKAQMEQRKKKLMGDPRVKQIEKLLRKVGPMVGKPEGWKHYTPATRLPGELLIARSLMLSTWFSKKEQNEESEKKRAEYLDPFARQFSFYNPKVKGFVIPETYLVDYYLIFWAEADDGVYEPAGLFRDIVWRQMRFMPLKSTRSFFIDPKGLGKNMRELIKMTKDQGGCGVCNLVTQSDEITKTMAELRQYVTKVRQTLTVNGVVDTTQYNALPNVKAKIPYTTLVIHDFPAGFNSQALEDLDTILGQANACGFTVLVSRDKKDPIDDKAKKMFYENEYGRHLEYRGEKCVYHDGDFKLPMRRMVVEPSQDFIDEFNAAYSYRPPVKSGFFEHMTKEYLAKPFARSSEQEIRFPFAVDTEGKLQNLVLDSDLKSYGLIIGGVGAGKTSLLHTIINSAAIHYSPQELEMWLIDYKLTSFDFYKRNPLPHLRHIVMDESDVLTYSVVDELRIEYAHRQRLFKKAGAKDFADYRAKGHKLPRLLVLIDEAHLMSQALADDPDYKLYMQNIIAQARYTGINILLADQKYSALGGFSGCLDNMYVRICLKNDISQVKDTLSVYNLSNVSEEVAAKINAMPAAAAGTMIYKHEERNPDDPQTKLVHYDHISCLYAPTDAFRTSVEGVCAKSDMGDAFCQIYEGPARLPYSQQSVDRYEQRNPMKPNEGERFYIGSPRGMGKCFSFSLKNEDEGENILLVGNQNELRGPLVANCIRNALRHGYHVVVLIPRASMFYKKNKAFVHALAQEFGQQVEFYTEYAEICRYIGLKANMLKALDEDDSDDFEQDEQTFVVCLGTDDLYKKMDDDSNTQAKAWANHGKAPVQQEEPFVQKKEPADISFWDGLLGNIEQLLKLEEEENEHQESESPEEEQKGGRFDDSIEALQALLGLSSDTEVRHLEELGAELDPVFQNTCAKSIGQTDGLEGYNAISDLNILIRDGWKLCFHTLLTVNSANGLKNMHGIKLSGNFNHRLALPMAPEQGSSFLYYTKALKNMADEGDQIGAVYEYMGGNGQRFIPYL